jgi:hypothetical protein
MPIEALRRWILLCAFWDEESEAALLGMCIILPTGQDVET